MPYKLNAKTVIFYQDKAPCHAAKSTQDILAEIFPCFILNNSMPPNAPDLNVLDYCVWSLLNEGLNKYGLIGNYAKLKKILKKVWNNIPQEAIRDAVDSWPYRNRAVYLASGAHIE